MKIYAYKNTPNLIDQSSSGGGFSKIISTFANYGQENYSIYGAAWTEELTVRHERVESLKDAEKFRGSKYVRSDIRGIYLSVKQDLAAGKYVIFSGTPCQVQGLKLFLQNQNISAESLFTIDIICHGAPNPRVWSDCKKWLENRFGSAVKEVTFRDKRVGWKRYPTSIKLENGRHIRWTYDTQIYIRMFLSLLILEKKCFSCPYSNMNRVSDITLGDYWGIDEIMPEIPAGKGVSLMLVNSTRGETLVNQIRDSLKECEILKEYTGDAYLKYQHNLNYPTEKPERYEEFWHDYNTQDFSYIVDKYKFLTLKGRIKFIIKSFLIKFDYFDKGLA